ncbi:MAG: adenylate/guanylate cyclase domain-containing protein [Deltaproteobacteria bacterium]|nr:adenylate/guanylate cyclase domain-containing protein [Deltaproteobacteria bacterium]
MSKNTLNLSRSIEKSKNEVTVLFTDIVDSTKFWDKHGDTAGRLMLDRHNKLLFPVVEAFRGTLIKTIGDSIMASFKNPKDGVEAAIAMQQQLRLARQKDKSFQVHIRIGVHTGQAIVESKDVFGDTVNVAARVESAAGTDEILVSEAAARRLKRKMTDFGLKRKRTFVPKGKRRKLSVWVCDWTAVRNLTDAVRHPRFFPPNKAQRLELVVYAITNLVSGYLIFHDYLRYLLAGSATLSPYLAPPHPMLRWLIIAVATGAILMAIRFLSKISRPPIRLFQFLKGGSIFGVLFIALIWIADAVDLKIQNYWTAPLYQPPHRLIEIVADDVDIFQKPNVTSRKIVGARKNQLYVLKNKVQRKRRTFAKVALTHDSLSQGFIVEQLPPKLGIAPVQQLAHRQLVLRYYHLYAFILGVMGFLYGLWSFRLKPL